ncbi:hypothetical protein Hanom_Chr16g01479801 [Helianthus anomalus]
MNTCTVMSGSPFVSSINRLLELGGQGRDRSVLFFSTHTYLYNRWYNKYKYVSLMLLGLGSLPGCKFMAAKSWPHQTYIWTCYVWFYDGTRSGFYVWVGVIRKTQHWSNTQIQGSRIWVAKLCCNLLPIKVDPVCLGPGFLLLLIKPMSPYKVWFFI